MASKNNSLVGARRAAYAMLVANTFPAHPSAEAERLRKIALATLAQIDAKAKVA